MVSKMGNNIVCKSNKLNSASFYNFNLSNYRVFLLLISKVGGSVNENGNYLLPQELKREHTLTVKEYSAAFNINASSAYRVLKEAVDKLTTADIEIEELYSTQRIKIHVCSMAKYIKGRIDIQFTKEIMQHLNPFYIFNDDDDDLVHIP